MQGEIIGEDDDDIGTRIVDNNGAEHQIEMHKENGEIYAHKCAAYADKPEDRTDEENEYVEQARRFARYFVYTERGYDVVPPAENPVRIDAVRQVVQEMSLDEFERHFGDLYQQFLHEERDAESSVIDKPPEATDPPIFAQNIFLGIDILGTDLGKEIAEAHGLDSTQSARDISLSDLTEDELEQWGEFTGEFAVQALDDDIDFRENLYIDSTTDIYVKYPLGGDFVADDGHLQEAGREPDTIIELLPTDPGDLSEFKKFLEYYLRCQIRDTFVEMGLVPPEPFQVLGLGRFMAARGYDYIDFYPEFHNPDAEDSFNASVLFN